MIQRLEDARKLAHGTYDDVIVVEHRRHGAAEAASSSAGDLRGASAAAVLVVLEMPEGSRVIDSAQQFHIDGVVGDTAPRVGGSYRLIVEQSSQPRSPTEATSSTALRYESMNR